MSVGLPVQDLIADVIEDAYDAWRVHPAEVAAAVVAAIQGATTRQQAELLCVEMDVTSTGRARLVGPWREDPA